MSSNFEDASANGTNQDYPQTEDINLVLSDPDATKSEWRLPLAIVFAIIMMIYLVIVIIILSGRAISL